MGLDFDVKDLKQEGLIKNVEKGIHLIHNNYTVADELLEKPLLKRFTINTTDKKSFVNFVQEYKTDATKIFYDNKSAVAIFDFHTNEEAKFASQHINLRFLKTKQYQYLVQNLDSPLAQRDFVRFLKTAYPDLIEIDGKTCADMDIIELAESLQAVKKFDSVQKNTSSRIAIDVEIKSGAKEHITLPTKLTFELPIFEADKEKKARIEAEIFVELDDNGKFAVILTSYTIELVEELLLEAIIADISRETDGIKAFQGIAN